jgi:amino acid permease
MLKSLVGIGILGMDSGFAKTGLILSIIILVFVYSTAYYTTILIVGLFFK